MKAMRRMMKAGALALLAATLGPAGVAPAADGGSASVIVHPGDDVAAIVAAAPAGSVFVFTPGLYRGLSITPRDGDRFIGLQHGAILDGARVVSGFTPDGAVWRAAFAGHPRMAASKCSEGQPCDQRNRSSSTICRNAPSRRPKR